MTKYSLKIRMLCFVIINNVLINFYVFETACLIQSLQYTMTAWVKNNFSSSGETGGKVHYSSLPLRKYYALLIRVMFFRPLSLPRHDR